MTQLLRLLANHFISLGSGFSVENSHYKQALLCHLCLQVLCCIYASLFAVFSNSEGSPVSPAFVLPALSSLSAPKGLSIPGEKGLDLSSLYLRNLAQSYSLALAFNDVFNA